jgi:hypothetical protein
MASKPRRQRNATGLPIQLGPSSLTSDDEIHRLIDADLDDGVVERILREG